MGACWRGFAATQEAAQEVLRAKIEQRCGSHAVQRKVGDRREANNRGLHLRRKLCCVRANLGAHDIADVTAHLVRLTLQHKYYFFAVAGREEALRQPVDLLTQHYLLGKHRVLLMGFRGHC